jgi:hypothetical protein
MEQTLAEIRYDSEMENNSVDESQSDTSMSEVEIRLRFRQFY